MKNTVVRGLIEYWDICKTIPNNIKAFKSETFNRVFMLDENSPEIDEICKVRVNSTIDTSNVIRTATGTSVDGQILTGWKIMIHGRIQVQIQYSSFKNGPSIFVITETLNFDSFVPLSPNTLATSKIYPDVFIEDLSVRNLDKKNFFISANLILMAYND